MDGILFRKEIRLEFFIIEWRFLSFWEIRGSEVIDNVWVELRRLWVRNIDIENEDIFENKNEGINNFFLGSVLDLVNKNVGSR